MPGPLSLTRTTTMFRPSASFWRGGDTYFAAAGYRVGRVAQQVEQDLLQLVASAITHGKSSRGE